MTAPTQPRAATAGFCASCGDPLQPGQRFCERCGAAVMELAEDAPPPTAAPAARPAEQEEVLVWERRVPLLTNRFVLWDFVRMTALGAFLMIGAVAIVGLFAGEGLVTLPWQVYAVTAAVVSLIFVFVCLVVLRNRYWMRFALTPAGVITESGRLPDAFNKIVVVAGALTLNPTLAGAGLIAASREDGFVRWDEIARVRYHANERVVSLSNTWRTIARLYCNDDNYAAVADFVRGSVSAAPERQAGDTARRSAVRTAAPYVVWVLLLTVFTILTRAWDWAADDTELTVLMAVALALPAGLVGRTGWILAVPSLLLTLVFFLELVGKASETFESIFGGTRHTYDLDTSLFWVSVAGGVGIALMDLTVIAGRGPWRWNRRPEDEGEHAANSGESEQ